MTNKKLFWVSVRYTTGVTDDLMYEAYNWEGAIASAKRELNGTGIQILGVREAA